MNAQGGERFQVRLEAGATTAIGAGDGKRNLPSRSPTRRPAQSSLIWGHNG